MAKIGVISFIPFTFICKFFLHWVSHCPPCPVTIANTKDQKNVSNLNLGKLCHWIFLPSIWERMLLIISWFFVCLLDWLIFAFLLRSIQLKKHLCFMRSLRTTREPSDVTTSILTNSCSIFQRGGSSCFLWPVSFCTWLANSLKWGVVGGRERERKLCFWDPNVVHIIISKTLI